MLIKMQFYLKKIESECISFEVCRKRKIYCFALLKILKLRPVSYSSFLDIPICLVTVYVSEQKSPHHGWGSCQ